MNQTAEGSGVSFMEKVSAFIVDKRSLIFLITIILLIFSAFSRNWVEVESDLTYYLPEDSETKQALNVMDEQFITYGREHHAGRGRRAERHDQVHPRRPDGRL